MSRKQHEHNHYEEEVQEIIPANETEEEAMMRMMGLPNGFDSTKGKYVEDDASHMCAAVSKKSKRKYAQIVIRKKNPALLKGPYQGVLPVPQ